MVVACGKELTLKWAHSLFARRALTRRTEAHSHGEKVKHTEKRSIVVNGADIMSRFISALAVFFPAAVRLYVCAGRGLSGGSLYICILCVLR
jgi:hypothetical protein